MHHTRSLYAALAENLVEINKQIEAVTKDVEKQITVLPYPDDVTVYQWKLRDGSYPLAPLLAAKAQILGGMAALKTADLQSKATRR